MFMHGVCPPGVNEMRRSTLMLVLLITVALLDAMFLLAPHQVDVSHEGLWDRADAAIRINSNSEFNSTAQSEGWQGDGSALKPYVIDGYHIDAHNSGPGIYIGNTTVHFVIENSSVYNSTDYSGIRLYNATNGTITNFSGSDLTYGVYMKDTHNMTVSNSNFNNIGDSVIEADTPYSTRISGITADNMKYGFFTQTGGNNTTVENIQISNCSLGIDIESVSNMTIYNDTLKGVYEGIYVGSSDNVSIMNTTITDAGKYGIQTHGSHNIRLENSTMDNVVEPAYNYEIMFDSTNSIWINNNTISEDGPIASFGIVLSSAEYAYLYGNQMSNTGLYLTGGQDEVSSYSISSTNRVNGKPILYRINNNYNNQSALKDYYGQMLFVNISWLNIEDVSSLTHTSLGVELLYSSHVNTNNTNFTGDCAGEQAINSEYIVMNGNYMEDVGYGLGFSYSSNAIIENNNISQVLSTGIDIWGSNNVMVKNNTVSYLNWTISSNTSNGKYGINVDNVYQTVYNCTVMNNTIMYFRGIGIRVNEIHDAAVNNNTLINGNMGLLLIQASEKNNVLAYSNSIGNTSVGISSYFEVDQNISSNTVYDSGTGFYVYGYGKDTAYLNNTVQNTTRGFYVRDADASIFINNTVVDSEYGAYIYNAHNMSFYNNTFVNDGIFLNGDKYTFTTQTIPENNTVNSHPIFYWKNYDYPNPGSGIANLSGYGQVLIGNLSSMELQNISASNTTVGVEIGYSEFCYVKYANIENTSVSGAMYINSSSGLVEYSNFKDNYMGVSIFNGTNSGFIYGNISGGEYGVYFDGFVPEVNPDSDRSYAGGLNISNVSFGLYAVNYKYLAISLINYDNVSYAIRVNRTLDISIMDANFTNGKEGIFINNSENIIMNVYSNYTNLYAHFKNVKYGIYMNNTRNVLLNNTTMVNGAYGVYLANTGNLTVENMAISNFTAGIYLHDTWDSKLYGNSMDGCGIMMTGNESTFTENVVPKNNTVNGYEVLYLVNSDQTGTQLDQDAAEIILANVRGAYIEGNKLNNGTAGLILYNSTDETIKYVNDSWNTMYGIYAVGTSSIVIENSKFENNSIGMKFVNLSSSRIYSTMLSNSTGYGIYMHASHGNLITNNTFYHNNGSNATYNSSHIQAYDDGTNQWNTTGTPGRGNFWSDWQSPDSNGDGIVDKPYMLGGGAVDSYPLTHSTYIPELNAMAMLFVSLAALLILRRK